MTEIQSVSPADYSIQQTQYDNEINNVPMAYNEPTPKKHGSKLLLKTLVALGLIGGGAYLIYRYGGKKGGEAVEEAKDKVKETVEEVVSDAEKALKAEKEKLASELEALKNSEAVKNYDTLKTDFEKLNKAAQEAQDYVDKKHWWNFRGVKKKMKELFDPFKPKAKDGVK